MRIDEYAALDGVALAGLIRSGEVRADEVAGLATEAHERVDHRVNAVIEWYDDPPPMATSGPLAGVPLLRKDYGGTERGRRTERGSRLSAGWTAPTTSRLMSRFAAAGLHVRGRSAVPEFILHASTESAVHGITRNPWNPSRSAGGSSGGAAAAVAAGVVPVAHASDCAGSIRIPASVCGLVGLKPTRGRVPWGDGSTAGGWGGVAEELVVARSTRDARCVLTAVADPWDGPPRSPDGGDLRVGVIVDHWAGFSPDPVLVDAAHAVAAVLAPAAIEPAPWPVSYDEVAALMDPLFGAGAAGDIEAVAAATGRDEEDHLEPLTLAYLQQVRSIPAATLAEVPGRSADLTRRLDAWIGAYDLVVCPTLGRASLPLGVLASGALDDWVRANDEYAPHSYLANVTGWPAVSVPWGQGPDGVPVGVQLMGRRGADELLLAVAETIETAAPALGRPPIWAGAAVHR